MPLLSNSKLPFPRADNNFSSSFTVLIQVPTTAFHLYYPTQNLFKKNNAFTSLVLCFSIVLNSNKISLKLYLLFLFSHSKNYLHETTKKQLYNKLLHVPKFQLDLPCFCGMPLFILFCNLPLLSLSLHFPLLSAGTLL